MDFSNFSQNVSGFVDGLSTFLIGITIVFATLILLIFIIMLVSKVVGLISNRANKKEAVAVKESTPTEKVVAEPALVQEQDDLELVAVITAAIAASLGTSSDKLQVRSLRKVERRTL